MTATGRRFYFMTHTPEDICLDDIAIALSRLCRYTGHTKRMYSVLEHSILPYKDEDIRWQMASAFWQRFVQIAEWYGAKI